MVADVVVDRRRSQAPSTRRRGDSRVRAPAGTVWGCIRGRVHRALTMTLRTVAGLRQCPLDRANGCPRATVAMYSSMIARRISWDRGSAADHRRVMFRGSPSLALHGGGASAFCLGMLASPCQCQRAARSGSGDSRPWVLVCSYPGQPGATMPSGPWRGRGKHHGATQRGTLTLVKRRCPSRTEREPAKTLADAEFALSCPCLGGTTQPRPPPEAGGEQTSFERRRPVRVSQRIHRCPFRDRSRIPG